MSLHHRTGNSMPFVSLWCVSPVFWISSLPLSSLSPFWWNTFFGNFQKKGEGEVKKNFKSFHIWKLLYFPSMFDWKNDCILGWSRFSQNFEGTLPLASSFQGCFWKDCHCDFHCVWAIFNSISLWKFLKSFHRWFSEVSQWYGCDLFSFIALYTSYALFIRELMSLNLGKLSCIILLLISTSFFSFLSCYSSV